MTKNRRNPEGNKGNSSNNSRSAPPKSGAGLNNSSKPKQEQKYSASGSLDFEDSGDSGSFNNISPQFLSPEPETSSSGETYQPTEQSEGLDVSTASSESAPTLDVNFSGEDLSPKIPDNFLEDPDLQEQPDPARADDMMSPEGLDDKTKDPSDSEESPSGEKESAPVGDSAAEQTPEKKKDKLVPNLQEPANADRLKRPDTPAAGNRPQAPEPSQNPNHNASQPAGQANNSSGPNNRPSAGSNSSGAGVKQHARNAGAAALDSFNSGGQPDAKGIAKTAAKGSSEPQTNKDLAKKGLRSAAIALLMGMGVPHKAAVVLTTKKVLVTILVLALAGPFMGVTLLGAALGSVFETTEDSSDQIIMDSTPTAWLPYLKDQSYSTEKEDVEIPWTIVAGILKVQTDFNRKSPVDTIDYDPIRNYEDNKDSIAPDGTKLVFASDAERKEKYDELVSKAKLFSCGIRQPAENISNDGKGEGPFLLNKRGVKEAEQEGVDPYDPCQVVPWVYKKMVEHAKIFLNDQRSSEEPLGNPNVIKDDGEGGSNRENNLAFWTGVISSMPYFANPSTGEGSANNCVPPIATAQPLDSGAVVEVEDPKSVAEPLNPDSSVKTPENKEPSDKPTSDFEISDDKAAPEDGSVVTGETDMLDAEQPRSQQSDSSAFDALTPEQQVSYLIVNIWDCEINKVKNLRLGYDYSLKSDDTLRVETYDDFLMAKQILIDEALTVAQEFSEYGTKKCSPNGAVAGVFPLPASTAAEFGAEDRCDQVSNISAAAKAVLSIEKKSPTKRSADLGKFQPYLGGWMMMPTVFGSEKDLLLQEGPGMDKVAGECKAVLDEKFEESDFAKYKKASRIFYEELEKVSTENDITPKKIEEIMSKERGFRNLINKFAKDSNCDLINKSAIGQFLYERLTADAEAAYVERVGIDPNASLSSEELAELESKVEEENKLTPEEQSELSDYKFRALALLARDHLHNEYDKESKDKKVKYGSSSLIAPRLSKNSASPVLDETKITRFLSSAAEDLTAKMVDYAIYYGGISPSYDTADEKRGLLLAPAVSEDPGSFGGTKIKVPDNLAGYFIKFAKECDFISPELLAAQAYQESRFNTKAKSPAGAQGLTQFMPATWAAHGVDGDGDGIADAFNEADSIASQAKYMCLLSNLYKGKSNQLDLTLAAYNAGQGNVAKYGNTIPPFKETQHYVQVIKGYMASFSESGGNATSAGSVSAVDKGSCKNLNGGAEIKVPTSAKHPTAPNGQVPAAEMCIIDSRGNKLRWDAALAFFQMDAAFKEKFGSSIQITDSYRTYQQQVAVKAAKGWLAAKPGTSNHGWGLALDLGSGINRFGTPQHVWMQKNAPKYGWNNPPWARQGGNKPEAWHWNFGTFN